MSGGRTQIEKAYVTHRSQGIETKDRVLLLVGQSEPKGITTKELCKAANLKRSRIHGICQEYMREGVLWKTGRFGTYHLTYNGFTNPHVIVDILQNKILKDLDKGNYNKQNAWISLTSKFCDKELCKTIVDKKSASFNQLLMFEFANRVGPLIVYPLIQALSQKNNEMARTMWLNSINLKTIFSRFRDLPFTDKKIVQDADDVNVEKLLTDIFASTWPSMHRDLNWLKDKMGKCKIDWQLLSDQEWVTIIHEKWKKDPPTIEEGLKMTTRQRIISGFNKRYPEKSKEILEIEKAEERKKHENHIGICNGIFFPEVREDTKGQQFKRCSKCFRWIRVGKN